MKDTKAMEQELEDLKIMYDNVLEHSTALEESLSQTNQSMNSLLQSMRKYLSPQLFEAISGGKSEVSTSNHTRKKLTIFFSDIVNFTRITDMLESEVMSELLNEYLNQMATIALKHGGTIDKFIGDAVMIFFGDPEFVDDKEHARRAVNMACDMQVKISELSKNWTDRGAIDGLKVRMGINTGYCTVGNFGSENRMDYTIIGGEVNIASRLENAAKPGTIAISETTWALVRDFYQADFVGEVEVKGVHYPIPVYRVHIPQNQHGPKPLVNIGQHSIHFDSFELNKDADPAERARVVDTLHQALAAVKLWT